MPLIEWRNRLRFFTRFSLPKKWLLLVFLAALALTAFVDFFTLGLARRTYVFYAIDSGTVSVENRKLRISGGNLLRPTSRELDITRYVEEALLGPVSPDSIPLFPKGTRLKSLMYREGVVYADFSEEAALPPLEGGEVFTNLKTLSGLDKIVDWIKSDVLLEEGV